ncbi:MAG TPA: hypothetical protein V6D22_06275 [Candidatus Obscuribacterales bacterium]
MTKRHAAGQSFIELGAAMIVLVPILLLLIDLSIIAIAAGLNDSVCRDSARAAASGPPAGTPVAYNQVLPPASEPYKRALAVVKSIYATHIPAKVRDTIQVTESVVDVPPAPQGGSVTGDVAVQTTIDVYPPFIVRAITPGGIALACRHSVAYTYVVPNTTP